jgi:hypothetical protein
MQRDFRFLIEQAAQLALDLRERRTRVNYGRHGFGCGAASPRASRSIQVCTSTAG